MRTDLRPSLWVLSRGADLVKDASDRAPGHDNLLLFTAARAIEKLVDIPFKGAVDPGEEPEISGIVLAPMPPPVMPPHPAADVLVRDAGVRLLLSQPSCVVLFLYPHSREALSEALREWIRLSPHQGLAQDTKYRRLATYDPMSWSFVTVEDLLDGGDKVKRRLEAVKHCARYSVYDPTGLRTFVHLTVSGLRFEDGAASLPPRHALVVDDEKEPCERFSYLVRRLGFSVVPAGSRQLWETVKTSVDDAGFELALVDNYLGFHGTSRAEGHGWLRQTSIPHRLFKTAYAQRNGGQNIVEPGEHLVDPRPADARVIAEAYKEHFPGNGLPGDRLGSPFFDFGNHTAEKGADPHIQEIIDEIGLALFDAGSRLEREGKTRQAAMHHLESFLLLRGRDGPMAARAFGHLQEIEVAELLEDSPTTLRNRWELRKSDILDGMKQAFAGPDRKDRGWWTARTLQGISRLARSQGIPSTVLQSIETATREVRATEYKKNGKRLRWLGLTLWNQFSRYFNSAGRVASAWILMVVVFTGIYSVWGIHLTPPDRAPEWSIIAKAGLASLAGGLGLMYPESIELGLPRLLHIPVGLVQRILSLLLFARMISLFISWVRDEV